MPIYQGGDTLEITCNHPTLGSLKFATKSNESYTLDPGGYRSNDDANSLTGGGTFVDQVNRVRWLFEGVFMTDFSSNNELDVLPELAASAELGTWTISHISGVVWTGKGKPVGDLQADTNTAQMTVKLSGGGKLVKL